MNDAVRVGIERYLDGNMTPREASEFLAAVQQDPEALASLGHALEDQAHLYDALREQQRGEATRRFRGRRLRSSPQSRPAVQALWVAGLAAAAIFAVLLTLSTSENRTRNRIAPAPREVAVTPPAPLPPPEPLPVLRPKLPDPLPPAPSPVPVVPRVEAPPPPRREDPAPKPPPEPPRPEPAPPREPVKPSAVAVADLNRVQGECFVLDAAGKTAARQGASLLSGQGLQTVGAGSAAILKFPDATRVDLGAASTLRDCSQGPGGKRLRLESGTLLADVAKQGAATPFVVATPQAEIVVVGTRFSIACTADSTRVDVREGRVRVTRVSDGASAEVAADQWLAVAPGGPVEAKNYPIDEILLIPVQAKIVGADWRAVKDADAATGVALESLRSQKGPLQDAPCAAFTVNVDAGKTYHVWVRGKCLARSARIEHDAVILDFGDSEVTEPPGPNKGQTGSLERGLFNGFMHATGYGWVGSDSDQGRDVAPVTVRFARAGRQTLRLYSWESPLRIDALWLSATQKTRPDDLQTGPKK